MGWAASIEICWALGALELGEERIAGRLVVHHGGIAEAEMHRDGAADAVQRPVEHIEPVGARLVGILLHPRLVDLDDVGAGREQVLDLGIDGVGEIHRHRDGVAVKVVLRLRLMVNGPGTVALILRSVLARSSSTSRTSTGPRRLILPTMRGTGSLRPRRLMARPGLSMSTPSSAVAKWLE